MVLASCVSRIATGLVIVVGHATSIGSAQDCGSPLSHPVIGDVAEFRISPDGSRVVYLADQDNDEVFELYSAPVDGGQAAVKLNADLFGGRDVGGFAISPDSTRVVYHAEKSLDNVWSLFSVPIAGGNSVKLDHGPEPDGQAQGFLISPDSSRVVFQERLTGDVSRLYSTAITGGAIVELSGMLATGGAVLGDVTISPDSSRVVYRADAITDGVGELFSRPIDGSGMAVRLNGPLATGGDVEGGILISPDSMRVLYRADQDELDVLDLYSVPIDGGSSATKLHPTQPLFSDVEPGFVLTNAGSHVLYRSDPNTNNGYELFLAPIDGTSPPVVQSGSLVTDGSTEPGFVITGDDGHIVYRADQDTVGVIEIYSVPMDGSQNSVRLNSALVSGGNVEVDFRVSADATRVVYRADQDADEVFELYTVPIDGLQAATRLNPALGAQMDVNRHFFITSDSARVVYTSDQEVTNRTELFSVPIDGSMPSVKLNDSGRVYSANILVSADGSHALYRGVLDLANPNEIDELFSVAVDGVGSPARLNGLLALGPLDGDILEFVSTPDGLTAAYLARENDGFGLYSVVIADAPCAMRIAGSHLYGGIEANLALSPDGNRVVYRALNPVDLVVEIFSVPIDGSMEPVRLNAPITPNGDVEEGFVISPDSSRVVYLADQDTFGDLELYSVPIDGSAPPDRLNATLTMDGDVEPNFLVSQDSSRVVYRADQDVDQVFELFSVPLDGSTGAVRLNGVFAGAGMVREGFQISPDSSRVLYLADEDVLGEVELHSAPIDGSMAAVELNAPLATNGEVFEGFQITPDSSLAVYRAHQDVTFAVEIYSVPLGGGMTPTQLNDTLANNGNVGDFWISSDSSRVVFIADAHTDGELRLFSVPTDGSSLPLELNGPMISNGDVRLAAISPDGSRVAYSASAETSNVFELYGVPIDGSTSAVKLSGTMAPDGDVQDQLEIDPSSSRVLYLADQDTDSVFELYSAPLDGSAPGQRLNQPLVPGGDVLDGFRITQAGGLVLYLADQGTDDVFELYGAPIDASTLAVQISHPLGLGKGSTRKVPDVVPIHPSSRRVSLGP